MDIDLSFFEDGTVGAVIFFILLILSGFFSGSETAFISSQRAKVHVWVKQQLPHSKKLLRYTKVPERYLITILVGNNFVNIAYSSLGTVLLAPYLSEEAITLMLTVIVLFFGEIIPKSIFSVFADKLILKITPIVRFIEICLKPLINFIHFITEIPLRKEAKKEEEMNVVFTRHEIHSLMTESEIFGRVQRDQKIYLKNVLSLSDTPVKDVMTPRTDMVALDLSKSVKDLYQLFHTGGFSKIPIYNEHIDNIIGIAFVYSVFKTDPPQTMEEFVEEAFYVPETKKCSDLLIEFKKKNKSIAIVIDEYGGTAGLVTIENLIQVVLGSLQTDEFNQPATHPKILKINDKTYRISGKTKKEELSSLGIDFEDGDFETVAGLVLNEIGTFPHINQEIEFEGFKLTIVSLTKKRIQWLKLELNLD